MDETLAMIFPWVLNWAPEGWHMCDGSILNVQQNPALFSLLGNQYGGDGVHTFALPDLRGRVVVCSALKYNYLLAQTGGTETVMLSQAQLPTHVHTVTPNTGAVGGVTLLHVSTTQASTPVPTPEMLPAMSYSPSDDGSGSGNKVNVMTYASGSVSGSPVQLPDAIQVNSGSTPPSVSISNAGGGSGHTNVQPYLALNYIICVSGLYPQRP